MTGTTSHYRASDPRGHVAVTRFECHTLRNLLRILHMHRSIEKEVRRVADGFLGAAHIVDWRRRTVLSVTLWSDLDSLYGMGSSQRHILAARVPGRYGITTSSGLYAFSGDWRAVLFGGPVPERAEPLRPSTPARHLEDERSPT
ncbi:hypothetical protein [Yinghuangia seranimata]|uniref:hypothetical protein n=1 Tax=Yinghuangia seranimata TaxID=408067 RepID=UPI00248B0E70|nr:hypothetical protein [Yinghuangia seranimata]MDI2131063.1 hypothetical protein [Yinghuangia seranimata]